MNEYIKSLVFRSNEKNKKKIINLKYKYATSGFNLVIFQIL